MKECLRRNKRKTKRVAIHLSVVMGSRFASHGKTLVCQPYPLSSHMGAIPLFKTTSHLKWAQMQVKGLRWISRRAGGKWEDDEGEEEEEGSASFPFSFSILRAFNLKQLRYYGAADSLRRVAAGSNPINPRASE